MSAPEFATLATAYQRLFGDAPKPGDAALVLDDLRNFCTGTDLFVPGQSDFTSYNCGMFRVWQRIDKALRYDGDPAERAPRDDGQASLFGDVAGRELAPAGGPLGSEGEVHV